MLRPPIRHSTETIGENGGWDVVRRLDRWSLGNAWVLPAAAMAALVLRSPWAIATAGALSALVLVRTGQGCYTPSGSFGAANVVTMVRLIGVCLLPLAGKFSVSAIGIAGFVLLITDGIDGRLARCLRQDSLFGARFDMETDGLLVLMISLLAFFHTPLGAWVILPGLLRYGYVIGLHLTGTTGKSSPRSARGRGVFLFSILCLFSVFFIAGRIQTAAALLATIALLGSFLTDFTSALRETGDVVSVTLLP